MINTRRTLNNLALLLPLALSTLVAQPAAAATPIHVFAAASLKDALDEVDKAWQARNPAASVSASYAASSALAKQIEQAAPADVFISADLDWMDYLDKRNLLKPGSRHNLLGNSLVLIAPAGVHKTIDLKAGADLAAALAGGKLAMGDVKSVPAGKYGKAALVSLGLWDQVAGSVAGAENVRTALLFVARGEAALGIVYGSDAKAEPRVAVAGVFPATSHPAIIYPVGQPVASANPAAALYLAFLSSPDARAIFIKWGFTIAP